MTELLENAGQILALLLSFCGLVGLVGKFLVLPWLEDRFAPLAAKVNETHHQVTVNGHTSKEPTLKDSVDSNSDAIQKLQSEVREMKGESRRDLGDMRADLRTLGQLYDAHIDYSGDDRQRIWEAVLELQRQEKNGAGNSAGDDERENQ